jgi:hypothetical protein
MVRVLVILVTAVLAGWALADVIQTPARDVRVLPKPAWAFAVLVPIVGALAWFSLGRDEALHRQPTVRRGPIGPDDDPDFLRGLGRRKPDL